VDAAASLGVVGNTGKMPPQLHRGSKLAALLIDSADCLGHFFTDDEHPRSMAQTAARLPSPYADRGLTVGAGCRTA